MMHNNNAFSKLTFSHSWTQLTQNLTLILALVYWLWLETNIQTVAAVPQKTVRIIYIHQGTALISHHCGGWVLLISTPGREGFIIVDWKLREHVQQTNVLSSLVLIKSIQLLRVCVEIPRPYPNTPVLSEETFSRRPRHHARQQLHFGPQAMFLEIWQAF